LESRLPTIELPKSSKPIVLFAVAALTAAAYSVAGHRSADIRLVLLAVLVSGYLADLFTGMMHFGFDYVFPDEMPILGPIAVEFRQHHTRPTLDPSNYVVNLTKGAYGSIPLALLICFLARDPQGGEISFFVIATLFGMSLWGFFFHQIHSYAHMGSLLAPEIFSARVAQIAHLPHKQEQIREFDRLFKDVPIPPVIRFLQDQRILLNPGVHNLHHLSFETDFSSVNGWSDPLMNWIYAPIARRIKAKQRAVEIGAVEQG
jgi:hypothetical protein